MDAEIILRNRESEEERDFLCEHIHEIIVYAIITVMAFLICPMWALGFI
jgi:hypothetical protein